MARTGSGKTAAFLIPMLERLGRHESVVGCRGVVLSPTRELASQTLKFVQIIGKFTDLRSIVILGGESIEMQFEEVSIMRGMNIRNVICIYVNFLHLTAFH